MSGGEHAPAGADPLWLSRFLASLRHGGVQLKLSDGRVVARETRPDVLTPELVATLREQRDAFAAYLAPNACADCGTDAGSGVRCSDCAARRTRAWREARR